MSNLEREKKEYAKLLDLLLNGRKIHIRSMQSRNEYPPEKSKEKER